LVVSAGARVDAAAAFDVVAAAGVVVVAHRNLGLVGSWLDDDGGRGGAAIGLLHDDVTLHVSVTAGIAIHDIAIRISVATRITIHDHIALYITRAARVVLDDCGFATGEQHGQRENGKEEKGFHTDTEDSEVGSVLDL
jgi:hypothetical protein